MRFRRPTSCTGPSTGAGHHSVLQKPGTDKWYIVYRRRPPGDTEGNHRQACIDETHFDQADMIQPVKITNKVVATQPLR